MTLRLLLLLLALTLSACGNKGDLYLPEDDTETSQQDDDGEE